MQPDPQPQGLELTADKALFLNEIQGLAVAFFENERPLAGLCGLLDWRFHGIISEHLRSGALSGRVGECIYMPCSQNGITYHLLLAGAGSSATPGHREKIPEDTFVVLRKNLLSLGLQKVGVSRSDFGNLPHETLSHHFKGVPLWIVQ